MLKPLEQKRVQGLLLACSKASSCTSGPLLDSPTPELHISFHLPSAKFNDLFSSSLLTSLCQNCNIILHQTMWIPRCSQFSLPSFSRDFMQIRKKINIMDSKYFYTKRYTSFWLAVARPWENKFCFATV